MGLLGRSASAWPFPAAGTATVRCVLAATVVLLVSAGCTPDSNGSGGIRTQTAPVAFPSSPEKKGPSEEDILRERFAAEREEILAELRDLAGRKEHAELFEKARPFVVTGDPELLALSNEAERTLILERLRELPATQSIENRDEYARLLELDPGNETYREKFGYYAARAAELERKRAASLEVLDWKSTRARYFFIVNAVVKNVSEEPLQGVKAVVDFRQSNGVLIVRNEVPLGPEPVEPGQVVTIETKALLTPVMYTADIDFRTALGKPVPWYREGSGG